MLSLYNTLTRKKEEFEPLNPPFVVMYVCGPTVYSHSHLGHGKSYVSLDVLVRYLRYLGFKVRYVQNITDVDDKINARAAEHHPDLPLNEAIRKMSLMPAQTLEAFVPQMRKKGRLQIGMDADIVVFDPATIADKATYEDANQPAVGVQTVLVNGGFVVQDGALVLDAPHGQPIRRAVVE